mgnify:CR=1 FL=1
MWFLLLQFLVLSPDTLWCDDFSDNDYTLNPEWLLINGTASIGGPLKHLFLSGDANAKAEIGTTGDGSHEPYYYLIFKTKIFNKPVEETEREWLIVKADKKTTYRVVFWPGSDTPGEIYIRKNESNVASASSESVILGSIFYVAIKVINDTISAAVSLSPFNNLPTEWDLIYPGATVDTMTISDTLWIGGWDIDTTGKGLMFDDIVVQTPPAGIEETYRDPAILSLNGYPNPFTQKTVIRYSLNELSENKFLNLSIYDLSGRLIRNFSIDEPRSASNEVFWEGKDESGKEVASGIYFCTLKSGSYSKTEKLVLIR